MATDRESLAGARSHLRALYLLPNDDHVHELRNYSGFSIRLQAESSHNKRESRSIVIDDLRKSMISFCLCRLALFIWRSAKHLTSPR